ncbi:FAD-dependent monooxygenase [Umezawaea tangerina]|uniref:2-polyprenyl-6-methoxyphenol hydroxylase-like FAD-dependent oxidoreductase n=1 Tax=Umezawaea tangerina TaxID=84725 RepID=A0A2T0T2N4_9PSEU|nr:FAD-dependent monooxygenase [Umezawaea tangerina]PRY39904.1 2-polyprenyl-6-methoxyphenol hydroxylase-like FAD-dependent oxidoreductase [Umezawaea tangerina]
MTTRIPVLICGGGIAGLTAALELHRQGVRAVLVEKHADTSPLPKARRIDPRSTEVFRLLGLADEVDRASAPLAGFDDVLVGPTMAEARAPENMAARRGLADRMSALSPAPNVLCPQNVLEPVLRRAAEERSVSVRFGTELVSFTQDDTGVTALLRPVDGDPYELTADYLIAADGARSPIRTSLGIPLGGHGHLADNLDLYFRADLTDLARARPFNLCRITNPELPGAFLSVNGTDRWLFSTSDFPDAAGLDDEDWHDLLRTAIGVPDVEVDLLGRMPWESAMRVADRFATGRVFLVGDAAHVMPPMAAAGANTAIADAANLSWKLAAVLDGTAGPALLDTYHVERHPVGYATAERSSQVVGNVGDMLSSFGQGANQSGDRMATLFGTQYTDGALIPDNRGPAPTDHYAPAGRPGTRIPHAWLDFTTSTVDLAEPGLTLVSGPHDERWSTEARHLGLRHVRVQVQSWLDEVALPADGALLLRPDTIIAWHSTSNVPLADALARILATASPDEQDRQGDATGGMFGTATAATP